MTSRPDTGQGAVPFDKRRNTCHCRLDQGVLPKTRENFQSRLLTRMPCFAPQKRQIISDMWLQSLFCQSTPGAPDKKNRFHFNCNELGQCPLIDGALFRRGAVNRSCRRKLGRPTEGTKTCPAANERISILPSRSSRSHRLHPRERPPPLQLKQLMHCQSFGACERWTSSAGNPSDPVSPSNYNRHSPPRGLESTVQLVQTQWSEHSEDGKPALPQRKATSPQSPAQHPLSWLPLAHVRSAPAVRAFVHSS